MKFLAADLAENALALERFQREARAASALNHWNICTIYEIDEFDTDDGKREMFIAMEQLQGESLDKLIAKHPMELTPMLELSIQTADVAHSHGIIHRDLKPGHTDGHDQTRLAHAILDRRGA